MRCTPATSRRGRFRGDGMKIGLIDVDARSRRKVTFPNLALMKLSAWHKRNGDTVEWWNEDGHYDLIYMSRVFGDEYTKDMETPVNTERCIKGGSGYAITVGPDGKEHYDKSKDPDLPYEVEHMMPDYALYGITDTAYGFLTKGCPRGCDFCHVKDMQGRCVQTVASLDQFWSGQKNIKLLDPNLTASRDWEKNIRQLADSRAYVDFTQGLDARLLTDAKIEGLNGIRWKMIHFAWDRPEENLEPHFRRIMSRLKHARRQTVSAYVLTNHGSTHEQDLRRIMILRELNIQPYVMIYRKQTAPEKTRKLQRWCSPFIFWKVPTFDEYQQELIHDGTKPD